MIICAITGISYVSPSHAAEGTGVSLPTALKSINTGTAIKHKHLNMYTWLIAPNSPPPLPPKDNRQQKVYCETTDATYNTMSEAAEAHGIDLTALSRALRYDKSIHSNTLDRRVYFMRV